MSGRIALEGECTIYRAADLKPLLLQSLQPGATQDLDLSEVTELDTAGVQLLLLAEREARAQGGALRLGALSPAAEEVFDLLDLRAHFGAGA
jgi:anti-anti-sigma factor